MSALSKASPYEGGFVIPKLSETERKWYEDAAYATPHEPYVLGMKAMRPGGDPVNTDQAGNVIGAPVQGPGTDVTREAYTNVFARSMTDPVLANGLDFGRIGFADSSYPSPHIGPAWSRMLPFNIAHGAYDTNTDFGVATQGRYRTPGANVAHELWHRGLSKIDAADGVKPDGVRHHGLMDAADAKHARRDQTSMKLHDSGAAATFNAELDRIERALAEAAYARRPRGGPR